MYWKTINPSTYPGFRILPSDWDLKVDKLEEKLKKCIDTGIGRDLNALDGFGFGISLSSVCFNSISVVCLHYAGLNQNWFSRILLQYPISLFGLSFRSIICAIIHTLCVWYLMLFVLWTIWNSIIGKRTTLAWSRRGNSLAAMTWLSQSE